ncbi:acetolactate synthase small subunit [Methanobrevibacter curvatus]|uniref:Acetolactate synthase small subunit n=1 Tax=Methanobrevibacter curvatus TaxID=49547 RepID=A0A166C9V7_9EURY|nr:acetolactate synthase small subunit [Methanobrevibacter curvatus]KZX12547.1 acetolactate synthase small subunit [Methanobrevibacter curvatus]
MNTNLNENYSHVISTLVENKPGVLQKVASLFTRRGFNIESITVGSSEIEAYARMVIIVNGDEKTFEQITKQLNKLVDVVKIKELNPQITLKRELCLLKVKINNEKSKSEIIQYVSIFKGKIIDISENNITIEITGSPEKINGFISLLKVFGIRKISRTGPTAIERDI